MVERTKVACTAPSRRTSSTYVPPTVRNLGSSLRRTRLPRMLTGRSLPTKPARRLPSASPRPRGSAAGRARQRQNARGDRKPGLALRTGLVGGAGLAGPGPALGGALAGRTDFWRDGGGGGGGAGRMA